MHMKRWSVQQLSKALLLLGGLWIARCEAESIPCDAMTCSIGESGATGHTELVAVNVCKPPICAPLPPCHPAPPPFPCALISS